MDVNGLLRYTGGDKIANGEAQAMTTAIEIKVTSQGVLIPRPLIAAWGDVDTVEIEQHVNVIIVKPKSDQAAQVRAQIVREMKAEGLIETLPWTQPPRISAEERTRLAEVLSQGKPLSEIIIEERGEHA
jgi:antitoxin component of MazEF toxin-antitoxin module